MNGQNWEVNQQLLKQHMSSGCFRSYDRDLNAENKYKTHYNIKQFSPGGVWIEGQLISEGC